MDLTATVALEGVAESGTSQSEDDVGSRNATITNTVNRLELYEPRQKGIRSAMAKLRALYASVKVRSRLVAGGTSAKT